MLVTVLVCVGLAAASQAQLNKTHCIGKCRIPSDNPRVEEVMHLKILEHERCVREHHCPTIVPAMSQTPCSDGRAGDYPCHNVDLLSFVPLSELGTTGDANDIWGWTDPETGREYAIIALYDGTAFVDVSEPSEPQVLGKLPTQTYGSLWRDVKVFKNHAFIVSEASNHGMQVFDLTQLREMTAVSPVRILSNTAFYDEFGSTHNIVSNEETGFMYAVGTRTCRGGLHMVDVNEPANPKYAGCFDEDGYVHDAQCLIYRGPDERYRSREICFCYNEDTLTIVDVNDKSNLVMLSRVPYSQNYYTHQGWLTEDQSHLLLDDELDELYGSQPNTRTLVWNVNRLDDPIHINSFYSSETASDHNLYIKGNLAFQSNYCAGLRILDVSEIEEGELRELGYFDVAPSCNSPGFSGAWSNYPYFESGTIIVSSIERGLFVLRFNDPRK
ncbi:uncharacterized protein LOC134186259 [Corticium candelabrum]|uniref:uncharacterized protein LOC134186259 n=1 Tax=Corticium candelabrum TaxID=121492 RepID=UPI002E258993|nr:uncharacterized protein LOC134186259 [Corticium candelabrum]